jgi:hypothetical protein
MLMSFAVFDEECLKASLVAANTRIMGFLTQASIE